MAPIDIKSDAVTEIPSSYYGVENYLYLSQAVSVYVTCKNAANGNVVKITLTGPGGFLSGQASTRSRGITDPNCFYYRPGYSADGMYQFPSYPSTITSIVPTTYTPGGTPLPLPAPTPAPKPPVLTTLLPAAVYPGTFIALVGTNFSTGGNVVQFAGPSSFMLNGQKDTAQHCLLC
jgi:hypothetical protein